MIYTEFVIKGWAGGSDQSGGAGDVVEGHRDGVAAI